MKRLIYCYPAFFNFILSGVMYFSVQRFTDAGASRLLISSTVMTWALVYCLMNAMMGRITNEKNAVAWLIAGCSVIILACVGFLTLKDLSLQFLWIAMAGIGSGLYCTPFQIFMKARERGNGERTTDTAGVVRAAGRYTFSWSVGFATAPLVFGRLRAETGFGVSIALMGLMLLGLICPKNSPETPGAPAAEPPKTSSEKNPPDWAWLGWLLGGVGSLAVTLVRCLWQPMGAELHLPQMHIDLILALVSYSQGLTGLLLSFTSRWFYRVLPALGIGSAGWAAMSLFSFSTSPALFYAAALTGGIYLGCIYFSLVFYALNHPTKAAFNVGINEIVVSVASIIAPVLGGWTADRFSIPAVFRWTGILIALTAFVHAVAMLRASRKNNEKGEKI